MWGGDTLFKKSKFKKSTLSTVLISFILLTFIPKPVSAYTAQVLKRLSGKDRFGTAAAICREYWSYSNFVILASSNNFPDALAGVTLAYGLEAPILLTEKDYINPAAMAEIQRLDSSNIIILGGTGAISSKVETTLKKTYNVYRIYGADRIKTAVAIGDEIIQSSDNHLVFLTTGANYPDALSIGPIAADYGCPILFSDKNVLSADTKNAILKWGIENVFIIGGTGAISKSVEDQLKAMGQNVARISGEDRYETSLKIADEFLENMDPDYITIATGANFPDALAAGPLAAVKNSLMLLVNNSSSNTDLKNFISSNNFGNMYTIGGTGVISDAQMNSIASYLHTDQFKVPHDVTGLKGSALSSTEIKLTWSKSADADHYNIYRDHKLIGSTKDITFTDTGLVPYGYYTYDVAGVNSYGEGAPMEIMAGTLGIKPEAPAGLAVTLNQLNQFSLHWNYVPYSDYYKIYRNGIYFKTVETEIYYDSEVQPNTAYTYAITAVNKYGEGNMAASQSYTTYQYPALKPANLTADLVSSTEINVKWDAVSGASQYKVVTSSNIYYTTANSYRITGLQPDTLYCINVYSITDAGESENAYIYVKTTP